MTVQIRPKFRTSIQNRNVATIVNGVPFGSTKAVAYGFKYMIPIDKTTRKLKLNFGDLVDNKWFREKEEDVNLPSSWFGSSIWKQPKITKQTYYELKHNRPQGFYNYDSFDITKFDGKALKQKNRTYLQTFTYTLKDGNTILNLDIPEDEIMYEAILANQELFATSYQEVTECSTCDFYISNITEEEELKASKRKIVVKTIADYNELISKYPNQVSNFVILLKISKDKLSDEIAENRLYDYVSEPTVVYNKKHEQRIEEFSAIFKLLTSKNPVDKTLYKNMIFLQQLINNRVITDYQDKYNWVSKTGSNLQIIGRTKKEAIDFLMDVNNEAYVKEMEAELNLK